MVKPQKYRNNRKKFERVTDGSSRPEVFCKKGVLFLEISQDSQENTCARVYFLIKLQVFATLLKKTLGQVFSCEICEIFKNNFFAEHFRLLFLELNI